MDVILLVFLLMLSIPLPVCFAGALLFLSLFGDVSMKTMLIWVFSQSTGTVLLASPLFILAGTYMGGSGIAKRLLDCVDAFVGHIKSGLTAYDTQKIRAFGENAPLDDATAIRRGALLGALTLYLDFINLFLMLLRLMGDRR